MFSTFLAAIVAVTASSVFPVTLTLVDAATDMAAPQGVAEVLRTLLMNVVTNPVQSLVSANYIGILVWAVLIGIALRKASDTTKQSLNDISAALSKTVTWIIQCAPFGIMGLVYNTVSVNGLSTFTEYGKLLAVLLGSMLFIYFVTNPILVFWCIRKNPYPLIFKCLKRVPLLHSLPAVLLQTFLLIWKPAQKWDWIRIHILLPFHWEQPSTWTVQRSLSQS